MESDIRPCCATLQRAIELIGRRWSGAIVRVLEPGPIRFSSLRASIPEITPRMLTERLRELEEAGIVQRVVLPEERPPGVEYSLTRMGRELDPILTGLGAWAHRWFPAPGEPAPPARSNPSGSPSQADHAQP